MTSVPAYGPNGLGARFQVGEKAGVIELADITVQQLGPDPAIAQAQAAITPAAIQARIRRYRMADLTVIVHDSKGRAVPQAAVTVSQTRHAFLFGCNIFGLRPGDSSPQQTAYQTRFAALFNYATLPFYWGTFEPTPESPTTLAWMRWRIGASTTASARKATRSFGIRSIQRGRRPIRTAPFRFCIGA